MGQTSRRFSFSPVLRAPVNNYEQLSDIPTVRELVFLMRAHGLTRCVLCPGSRNSPIVRSLSGAEGFCCRAVTDERSAGYIALGWSAAAGGAPVAVCVTSGSALLNLHPAVAEAHYRRVPLLIISADRPGAWIGQQDGQTLPQIGVYGSLVNRSLSLPESGDSWHRNRLINEAMLALHRRGGGPVQLNIPLTPPLGGVLPEAPAPVRVIRRSDLGGEPNLSKLASILEAAPRRMLLLGQLPKYPDWAEAFYRAGWALVGEHLSNADGLAQTRPDRLLPAAMSETLGRELSPDLLISCGGCLISPRLKALLRRFPPREHWHLSPDGEVIDSFCCLSRCLAGQPEQLLPLANIPGADPDFAARWMKSHVPTSLASPPLHPLHPLHPLQPHALPAQSPAADTAQVFETVRAEEAAVNNTAANDPPSGLRLVGQALSHLQPGDTLHLANSSAVRLAQLFDLPRGVQVECNRGTNGIEGSLSTAIGYAQSPEARGLQLLIIGDLSFFYDMNALGLPDLPPNLRLLLLNNSGGGIFATLPGPPNAMVSGICRSRAEGWARSCACRYLSLQRAVELPALVSQLMVRCGSGPTLLEAFTDAGKDAAELTEALT